MLRECITIIETDDWSNVTRPDVLDIICPNNCWGNGNCSDGKYVKNTNTLFLDKKKQAKMIDNTVSLFLTFFSNNNCIA